MKNYNHILLAIDVYENDVALIEEALNLAKSYGSKLTLIHVAPHIISSASSSCLKYDNKYQE